MHRNNCIPAHVNNLSRSQPIQKDIIELVTSVANAARVHSTLQSCEGRPRDVGHPPVSERSIPVTRTTRERTPKEDGLHRRCDIQSYVHDIATSHKVCNSNTGRSRQKRGRYDLEMEGSLSLAKGSRPSRRRRSRDIDTTERIPNISPRGATF